MNSENSTTPPIVPIPPPSLPNSAPDVHSPQVFDKNSPEAPILALINRFPRGFSTVEEGQKYLQELQTLRQNAPAFRSKLVEESAQIERKTPRTKKPTQLELLEQSMKDQGFL